MKTSLDHLPERKQRELQRISTLLRDTLDEFVERKQGRRSEFKIRKIILFGSHVKGGWVGAIPKCYPWRSSYKRQSLCNTAKFDSGMVKYSG